MPVADTELLFALSPRDPKHAQALKVMKSSRELKAPDTAIFEFFTVLRARGIPPPRLRMAALALSKAFAANGIAEVKTIDTNLLILQAEIEQKHRLSFFDSLVAASALAVDGEIVSDDPAFDRVPGLRRKLISG